MKTLFKLMTICTIVAFSISSCSEAYTEDYLDSHLDCSDWCDDTNFDFPNDGDCMSLCTTCNNPSESAGSTAVCICNWYQQQSDGDWDQTPFKNKGQCIKEIMNTDGA